MVSSNVEASVADLGNDGDTQCYLRHRPTRKEVNMEAFLASVKERGIDILQHLVPTPYVICLMGNFP